MGKKKYYPSTSVSPMMQEDDIPSSNKLAITQYVATGGSLVDILSNAFYGSIAFKLPKVNRWVEKDPSNYYYGKMTSAHTNKNIDTSDVYLQSYLSGLVGETVTLNYSVLSYLDNYHISWELLKNSYGYSATTNILSGLTSTIGTNCYLEDMVIGYCKDTIDTITNAGLLEPTAGMLPATFGATQNRVEDLGRPQTAWVALPDPGTVWAPDLPNNKDNITVTYTYRRVETRVYVYNDTTMSVVSDDTTSDVATPTLDLGLGDYEVVTLDSTTVSSVVVGPDTVTTTTTVTHYDYFIHFVTDFLAYEASGFTDPSYVLDEFSPNNIDPDVSAPSGDPVSPDSEYFMVYYSYVSGGDTYRDFFTYEYGSGGNPSLDNIFNTSSEVGNFLPRIYFRLGGQKLSVDTNKETLAYKSSTKLCKKLGLSWKDVSEQLHKAVGDLEFVDEIMVASAVALNSTQPLILDYLINWLDTQYSLIPSTFTGQTPDELATLYSDFNVRNPSEIRFSDNQSRQVFGFAAIGSRDVTGSIGEVGHVESTYTPGYTVSGEDRVSTMVPSYYIYRVQVFETSYREILVVSPYTHMYFGGRSTTLTGQDNGLILPVDMNVVSYYSNKKTEELLSRSLYVIINTTVIVKVKWYQTGLFKAVIFVVAIVLAVLGQPEALSVAVVVTAIVETIILQILVNIVVKFLVNTLGIDVGVIAGIVAIVSVVVGTYIDVSGMAVNFISTATLMQIANVAFMMADAGFKYQMRNLEKEKGDFYTLAQAQQKEIERARNLITEVRKPQDYLNAPSDMSRLFYHIGESPSDFYNRTIHSGNLGVIPPLLISSYHNLGLRLPDPKETLNQIM